MDADFTRLMVEAFDEVATFSEDDLEGAPLIDDWVVAGDAEPCLIGRVTGHPTIRDGRLISTSLLLAISVQEGWARTLSRFYRLGRSRHDRHVN